MIVDTHCLALMADRHGDTLAFHIYNYNPLLTEHMGLCLIAGLLHDRP